MWQSVEAWLKRASQSSQAELWLAICAFFNSFVSPIPAETLLIPLCLARRERSWRYAGVATIAAVLGGLVGYVIGAAAFTTIGAPIIEFYGATQAFEAAKVSFNDAGAQWILLATITPLPYKVVTLTSGAANMNLLLFLTSSITGRFIGYYLVAALVWRFGDAVRRGLKSPIFRVATLLILAVCGYLLLF